MKDFESVYTVQDFHNGPRFGIADFNGQPHLFQIASSRQSPSAVFYVSPLSQEVFDLALEDWNIWLRWKSAHRRGETTLEHHPALPEDRQRHNEIKKCLANRLSIDPDNHQTVVAEFRVRDRQSADAATNAAISPDDLIEVRWLESSSASV